MRSAFGGAPRQGRLNGMAAVLLAAGVVLSGAAGYYVQTVASTEERRRFAAQVSDMQRAVGFRMDAYVEILLATRGFFAGSEYGVTGAEFSNYVDALQVDRLYPGMRFIAYAPVSPGPGWNANVRSSDKRCPIVFVEPPDPGNRRSRGLDLLAEPVSRAALERARDSGGVVASRPLVLLQDGSDARTPGVLLAVPIFGSSRPRSVAERRATIEGFVVGGFRGRDLFRGIFPRIDQPTASLRVFDGPPAAANLLYQEDHAWRAGHGDNRGRLLGHQAALPVADREWTLVFTEGPGLSTRSGRFAALSTVTGGLLISVLLSGIVSSETRARAAAEDAQRRAAFLDAATARFNRSLDLDATLSTLAEVAVPGIADYATIEVVRGDGRHDWLALVRDHDGLRRSRQTVAPPSPGAMNDDIGPQRVLRTGYPELHEHATERVLDSCARDEAHRAPLRQLGLRSLLIVPLIARERPFGAITIAASAARPRYGLEDLTLIQELGRRAAMAMDNARLYAEARQAVRLREEFLSVASHELRAPVSTLLLQVDSQLFALQQGAESSSSDHERRLRRTRHHVLRLSRLINQLLDVSRLSAGRDLELQREQVNLAEVVQDLLMDFEQNIAESGCDLTTKFCRDAVGLWDRARIEQVVTNLITNALKYGAGKPITVTVDGSDEDVRMRVSDQGVGIAPSDVPRLFNRFERAESGRGFKGMGLGLWIVRQIATAHGGTIELESELGAGSTFTLNLPRRVSAAAANAAVT